MSKLRISVDAVSAGYAPASILAVELDKALSTFHRLAEKGVLGSLRDGHVLYINVASLANYFRASRAEILAQRVLALHVELQARAVAEASARDAARLAKTSAGRRAAVKLKPRRKEAHAD